jgi:hypothetical protein
MNCPEITGPQVNVVSLRTENFQASFIGVRFGGPTPIQRPIQQNNKILSSQRVIELPSENAKAPSPPKTKELSVQKVKESPSQKTKELSVKKVKRKEVS